MGNLSNIKNSINALRSLNDSQKALEYLLQGSPQMKQALEYVKQNGGDPKSVCYDLLKQNGIDPSSIEQALK